MNVLVRTKNGTHRFACDPDEKVLHAGLRSGLDLPYECATGTCGTCKARVVSGRIESAWPGAPGSRYLKGEAEVLMCQGLVREDCTLEVGRVVAAEMPVRARLQTLGGVLHDRRMLTHDVAAFEVALDRPLDFEAGQFVLVSVPGIAGARAYSMVNFDRRAGRLSFVVKKKPGGAVSEWLLGDGVEGASLALVGPLGHAIFKPDACKHVLCVAGGSGIAGMMSILARAKAADYFSRHKVHVFFGVRTMRDVFFLDELAAYPQADITVALSEEDPPANTRLRFERGLVHEVAKRAMAGKYQNLRAYVAGPPPAVDAAIRVLLLDAKLTTDNIRYDKFS